MAQPMVCGDNYIAGQGASTIGTITTSTSTNGLLLDSNNICDITAGECITTAGSSTISISAGNCIVGGYTNSAYGYGSIISKNIVYGKDGDVLMDLKNMKFKVYSDDNGWVEYDIEDFSTKNKKVELNGSKDVSICEMIAERNNRTVLVEKMPKKKESLITVFPGGTWVDGTGINTVWVDNDNYNLVLTDYNGAHNFIGTGTGTINTAIGYTALNTQAFNSSNSMIIQGPLTVEGDIQINGDITVNGNVKVSGIANVSGSNGTFTQTI